ncbi:MAG: helix-turn-helix transcriptional regulator [Lawsonibacter sp.]|nr:helix-turn-helix transcriptional regulator [Lawsonibacter sp.]
MNAEQIWQPVILEENREPVSHREPGEEFLFYRAVAAGLIDAVQENCDRGAFENLEGTGRLSNDPVTNLRYHFVVATAMITRFCTEGGMPMEEAFTLSDEYIRRMDCCTNIPEIIYVHHQMAMDFVCRMRQLHRNVASSKQVARAIDYIYVHIMDRITVNELAAAISISPTHLSRIFKQETGISVSEYIRQRKIDMAKNLLRFSGYDYVEIAVMLSYSSQSHFIQHFRSQTGMTPKAYRKQNYLNNWNVNREPAT